MPRQAIIVDARGMRCPWPALRLARAVREAGPGAAIELLADDPAAETDVPALARERGWMLAIEAEGGVTRYCVSVENDSQ